MGNFLDILKEIESCRMAGFGRPALFEALMLPDICGETRVSEDGNAEKKVKRKYIRWIEEYVSLTHPCIGYNEEGQLCEQESEKGEYLSLSAQEIYSLRNCLFHGGNVRCFKGKNPEPYVFDFSQVGIAQLEEQRSPKPKALGSSPSTPARVPHHNGLGALSHGDGGLQRSGTPNMRP